TGSEVRSAVQWLEQAGLAIQEPGIGGTLTLTPHGQDVSQGLSSVAGVRRLRPGELAGRRDA
ncbi:MAG: hypothetical protein OXF68_12030, partial [Gammaproteobacteria bacterium]|nr:hypothetical protein [Gammaproteobacteria bacterium]